MKRSKIAKLSALKVKQVGLNYGNFLCIIQRLSCLSTFISYSFEDYSKVSPNRIKINVTSYYFFLYFYDYQVNSFGGRLTDCKCSLFTRRMDHFRSATSSMLARYRCNMNKYEQLKLFPFYSFCQHIRKSVTFVIM